MNENRNSIAQPPHGETPGNGWTLFPQGRAKWRLLLGIVVLAWLGGLLAARLWKTTGSQPLPEQAASELPPLPVPELKPDLDPEYRALMEEGLEASRQVVAAFPGDANAVSAMAMLHHLAHDKAGEEVCWQRCLELDPTFSQAYQWLATRATDDGDYQKAETLLRRAMETGCALPEFPMSLGAALLQQGKLDKAATVLEEDVRKSPRRPGSRVLLGQVYLQLKENEKAKEQFEGALLLLPSSTQAYLGLATAYTRLGLKDEAKKCRDEFERLKKIEVQAEHEKQKRRQDELVAPQWVAEILRTVGKVYQAHQQPENAERHLLRASKLAPGDTESRDALSQLYIKCGRNDDALRIVQELAKTEPQNLAHLTSLGLLYGRLGQFEKAEEAFRQVCKVAPQRSVGYAGLAEIYLRTDKSLPEAKTLAAKAAGLEPSAWNYFILAALCEKTGDAAGAQAAMKKAEALDPQNPLFQKIRDAAAKKP